MNSRTKARVRKDGKLDITKKRKDARRSFMMRRVSVFYDKVTRSVISHFVFDELSMFTNTQVCML